MKSVGAAFLVLWLVVLGVAWRHHANAQEKGSAVPRGLAWLARNQEKDGRWASDDDASVTAQAALAYLGAGFTPKNKTHGETVRKALAFLLARQGPNGDVGGPGLERHALATLALAEAFGITNDATYRPPVERAIAFIESARMPGGVWGRVPRDASPDDVATGVCVMAWKSAEIGGLASPPAETVAAIRSWARSPAKGDVVAAAYHVLGQAFFDRRQPLVAANFDRLLLPSPRWEDRDFGRWQIVTNALFRRDSAHDAEWKKWKKEIMDLLAERQSGDGSWEGDPRATACATLNLEIYEREPVFGK